MYKYMNKFFCFLTAMLTSVVVNLFYQLENAFALTPGPDRVCNTVSTVYHNNICQYGSYWYPNSGSKCGTAISSWSHCKEYGRGGWSCKGSVVNASYAYCNCSSLSYVTYQPLPKAEACGTKWYCGSESASDFSIVYVECNTGPNNAGYSTIAGGILATLDCACCPSASDLPWDQGSGGVYSAYDAGAASDCYIMGTLRDSTGLYQYTDENKCYYAS